MPEDLLAAEEEDECNEDEQARDVRTITLKSLNLRVGQTVMHLFDYGDKWRFKVRVHAVKDRSDPDAEYPRLVESVGQAPPQYSDRNEEPAEDK